MDSIKYLLLLACAAWGAGLYAEESAHTQRPRPKMKPDFTQILQLSDAEKKTVTDAEAAANDAIQKIRKQAKDDAEKKAAASFDVKLKVYKKAADRLTDAQAKEKALQMLIHLEANRQTIIKRTAARILNPPQGKRPAFRREEPGERPMRLRRNMPGND